MPIAVPTRAIVRSAGLSGFMPAATMSDNSETSREAASVRSTTPLLTPLVSPGSLMSAPQSLALRIGQERRKAPARLLPLLHLAHAGATRGVVARARHGRRLLHLRQRRGRGRVLAHAGQQADAAEQCPHGLYALNDLAHRCLLRWRPMM